MTNTAELHPSTKALLRFFQSSHLPPRLQIVSESCSSLATTMISCCGNNAEFTAGLRKLLEAKDCFVRSALPQSDKDKERI